MALNVGELVAYLRLEGDQFRAGLAAAEGQAGRAQRSLTGLSGAATRVSSALKFVGVAGGVMSVAGVLKSAVTAGMDFTTALNTMQAVSGASASQLQAVSAAARQLGTDSSLAGTSSVDAANAMLELAKGGFTVEQSMQAAKGTLQLAAAAQIEAAEAATIQSQALQAFGLQADYAGKASDILANAANASSAEITDVAMALQQSGAVANQFGLSMTDTAATIALLANAGIQGSDAGTLLKSSLLALTDTSDPAQTAIKELGLTVYDANGRFAGMETLFGQLQAASKRMTPEMYQAATATLFGSDAMRLSGIAAQQGADGFAKMRAAMDQSGSAAAVAAAKMQGLPGAWENLKNNFEEASLTIYDAIKGPLTAAANGASSAIDGLVSKSKQLASSIGSALNEPGNKARLTALVDDTRNALSGLVAAAAALGPSLGDIVGSLAQASAALGVGAWQVLVKTLQAATGILSALEPLLSGVANLMSGNQVAVTALVGAWLAFKTIPALMGRVTATLAPMAANALSAGQAMTRLATANNAAASAGRFGSVQLGRFGSVIAGLGQHAPVIARMQTSFLQAAAGATTFGRTAGVTAAAMTGLRAAGSNVAALFGGPFGLALAGAAIAIGFVAAEQGKAKQQQEAYAAAVQRSGDAQTELNAALMATRGAATADVMAKLTDSVAAVRAELDATAKHTTDGILHGDWFPGQDSTNDKLKRTAEEAGRANEALDDLGLTNENLAKVVQGSRDAFDARVNELRNMGDGGNLAADKLEDLRGKYERTAEAARRTSPGFHEAREAVELLGDSTATAADKADALKAAMDAMNPARTVQEATAQYAETIDRIAESLDSAVDRTQGFGDALVDQAGSIDTFTANGANLHGTLKDMADAAADVAANNGDMGRVNQENEKTFAQLAQQYGVSIERIRAAYQNLGGSTIDLTMNLRGADTTQQQLGLVYSQLERIQPGQPKTIEVRADDITDQTRAELENIGYKLETIDRNGVKTIRISSTAVAVGRELEKLGIQTQALPDGKVKITDTSPEVMARLQQLGVQTETLPDGSVIIKASTGEFWREMQRVTRPETKYVSVIMQNTQGYTPNNSVANVPGAARQFHSAGGWTGPGHKYQEVGIVHADEYVIKKESQNKIERENPGALDYMNRTGQIPTLGGYADGGLVSGYVREPYGLDPNTNTGGYGSSGAVFPAWVHAIESAFGVKASTYSGHQVVNGKNTGIDWSGSVEALQKLAEYFASIKEQMRQVIWNNPETGQKIGVADGQMVGPGTSQPGYYSADWGDHANHVHTSQLFSLPAPGQTVGASSVQGTPVRTIPLVQNPDGTWTSTDPAWAALIKRESGGNPSIVQGVQDANSGGNEASGLFQIAKGTWASNGGDEFAPTAGQATPQQQAIVAARIFDKSGGAPWGAGMPGREDENALRAGIVTTIIGTNGVPTGTDGTDGTDGTGTQQQIVYRDKPEDPNVFEMTFTNPLEPFWWRGEKEYRDRLINDYKKQQEWDDYINGRGDFAPQKDGTSTRRSKVKTVAEATEDLENAKTALAIAEQRQRELKPDAKESQKMSAEQAVEKAKQKRDKAEADLKEAQANPSGYKTTTIPKHAAGGTVAGSGNQDSELIWAMPGEEIIRKQVAEQPGVRKFLKQLNAGKLGKFAAGGSVGFGGYSADTSDYMKPTSLNDWLYLAAGAGFSAYNSLEKYAQMAATGNVDLGNLTPELNTSSNDTAMVSQLVGAFMQQVTSQLKDLIWAVKEGHDVRVKVQSDNAPSAAGMVGMARGV